MVAKLSFEFVKEEIEKKGCVLVSTEYKNNNEKLEIIFICGHKDRRSYCGFQKSEPLCRKCTGHEAYSFDESCAILNSNGFNYVSGEFINGNSNIIIRDESGYRYKTNTCLFLQKIKNGTEFSKFEVSNPFSIENIKLWLSLNCAKLHLEDNQKYVSEKTKMTFYDDDGYYYHSTFDVIKGNILTGHYPSIVDPRNKYSLNNIQQWLINNGKKLRLLEGQKYTRNIGKLKFRCLVCSEDEFDVETTWQDIQGGGGCAYCCGQKIGKCNNLKYKHPDIVEEWDYKKNTKNPENITPHTNKKYHWICSDCGHSYPASPNARLGVNKSGCPKCSKSKGEKIINKYLEENNIHFSNQFYFKDCRHKGLLFFDFAIFKDCDKKDLLMLIEYDGELHFKPRRKTTTDASKLENIKIRDEIKNAYCKNNNINLLRIPYWEYKNIEKILEDALNLQGKEVYA